MLMPVDKTLNSVLVKVCLHSLVQLETLIFSPPTARTLQVHSAYCVGYIEGVKNRSSTCPNRPQGAVSAKPKSHDQHINKTNAESHAQTLVASLLRDEQGQMGELLLHWQT